jgi:hypothetical protein
VKLRVIARHQQQRQAERVKMITAFSESQTLGRENSDGR